MRRMCVKGGCALPSFAFCSVPEARDMSEAPVLVGVAGWSYDDWNDVVYPARCRDKLAFMADFLDCVEINSSFYRPFTPRVAEKWLKDVSRNDRFQFTAKVWQRFTHEVDKPYTASELDQYLAGTSVLKNGGRLLALLLQFPFYFGDSPENRDLLRRLAADLKEYRRVLEVRHVSWGEPEALEFVESLGLNVACLDMPLSKASFREFAVATGDLGYLRLHGRNSKAWFSKNAGRDDKYNYLYNDDEMSGILERIKRLREGADAVVVVWNNHFRGKAAVNAFQTLSGILGGKVAVPEPLQAAYPQLMPIANPGKGMLF